jgi:hypothetical protein
MSAELVAGGVREVPPRQVTPVHVELAAAAFADLPGHRVGIATGLEPDVEMHPVLARPLGLHLGTQPEQRT